MVKKRKKDEVDFSQLPACEGYIVIDPKKCCGCQTCMMACSLAHGGKINTKIARIQVMQDPYEHYPNDIDVAPCRQCVYPECLAACPVPDAIFVDTGNGNVRRVDESKCIGCQLCVTACPFIPSSIVWNFEEGVAQKCDLCIDTPHWDEKGGFGGKQACVDVCPMDAIELTREIPTQIGDTGYKVNLRKEGWPLDRG
ncbi:MAG: 4Fe-4S dicluster domain-containing protein [Deltaproteobacteria bacterium]|nr:4Fe-4S dicluster domain-containing protein [Deltaproteobacteria bacterium]